MAVTKKLKATPMAVTAASPEVHTETLSPPASKNTQFDVELTGAKTYIAPDGSIYRAGEVYHVGADKLKELFSYRNELDVRYFGHFKAKKVVSQQPESVFEPQDADAGLIDTGAMSLRDSSGRPVGVVGDDVVEV